MSFREPFHQGSIAPIGSGQGDLVEQLRDPEVEGSEAFPTGPLSKGTGQEGFPHSGRTRDEEILVAPDPLAGREAEDHGFFDPSGSSEVNVLWGGLKFEFGLPEEAFEPFVLLPGPLSIHEDAEAFLEREVPEGRLFQLFLKAIGHPGEFHRVEFIKGLFVKHDLSFRHELSDEDRVVRVTNVFDKNSGWSRLGTPKRASPSALQSIVARRSMSLYPPNPSLGLFIGNTPFPEDSHARAEGGKVETKKSDPTDADPIRS
jgi:hypothetical protein